MTELLKLILVLSITITLKSCDGHSTTSKQVNQGRQLEEQEVVAIDDRIWVVFQDSRADYWFGSNGQGVLHYDGKQLKRFDMDDGLVDNTIRGIQEDQHGHIYIETPEGISQYDGKAFTTLEPLRSADNEWKLDSTDLWFGYDANDLYRYDGESLFELKLPRQNLYKAFGRLVDGIRFNSNNQGPYAVYGVDQDKDGHVWFGTVTAGAFRYDGTSFLWFGESELSTLPDGRVPGVRSMLRDKEGYYWLSNFKSKYKIDADAPKGYVKMKAAEIPASVAEDNILYFNSGIVAANGDLWMTTYGGGVWRYDGTSLSHQKIKRGKGELLLITIYEDDQGTIWLGTDNDGVYQRIGERFEKFEPSRKE